MALCWSLELILFPVLSYVQLPFPMDSLYADPDRKVINFIIFFLAWSQGNKCSTLDVFNWRISYSGDYNSNFLFCNRHTMCWAYTMDLVELSSIQLVYVSFLFSAYYLSRTIFFMICMYVLKTMIRQAKVFSRFEALQKAVKNYTIEATPDDRSSVLQQVWTLIFLSSIIGVVLKYTTWSCI